MRLDTDLAPNFTETERARRKRSCFSNTAFFYTLSSTTLSKRFDSPASKFICRDPVWRSLLHVVMYTVTQV